MLKILCMQKSLMLSIVVDEKLVASQSGHVQFGHFSPFLSFFQLLLGFPEFGQIQSGNLFRVLNLLLVSADFALQFVHQFTHLFHAFAILLRGEFHLLDFSVGFYSSLVGINGPQLSNSYK